MACSKKLSAIADRVFTKSRSTRTNDKQRTYFARASGAARFGYNWALGEWQSQYKAGEKPSETSLRRQLNALKREQFHWMFDVTKCAVQEAIIDLGAAFRGSFEKRGALPAFQEKRRA